MRSLRVLQHHLAPRCVHVHDALTPLRELLAEPSVFNNKLVNLLNRGFLGPERLLRLLGHLPGELDLLDVNLWEGVLARLGRGSRG